MAVRNHDCDGNLIITWCTAACCLQASVVSEWNRKNKQMLTEELMKILPLVDEANAICQALGKFAKFEVELLSQTSYSSPLPPDFGKFARSRCCCCTPRFDFVRVTLTNWHYS